MVTLPGGVYHLLNDRLGSGLTPAGCHGPTAFSARASLRAEEIIQLGLENCRRFSKWIFVLKRKELGGRT